ADLVGRWELLRVRDDVVTAKGASLDLAPLIDPAALPAGRARRCEAERNDPPPPDAPTLDDELAAAVGAWLEAGATADLRFAAAVPAGRARGCEAERTGPPPPDAPTLDDELAAAVGAWLEAGATADLRFAAAVHNGQRTVGARAAGLIARRFGDAGLADVTCTVELTGAAGQSLGAFALPGMRVVVRGEAQDYVGKSLAGGEIVLRPDDPEARGVIAGNTLLYGATAGALFAAGSVGERVCVRNSGATAVVEGCGDHGCEYMTGGTVVVLGPTGRNFGAGMTGGTAWVLDEDGRFPLRLAADSVAAERLSGLGREEEGELLALLERHAAATGSLVAQRLLAEWPAARGRFWRVLPRVPAEAGHPGGESVPVERPEAA